MASKVGAIRTITCVASAALTISLLSTGMSTPAVATTPQPAATSSATPTATPTSSPTPTPSPTSSPSPSPSPSPKPKPPRVPRTFPVIRGDHGPLVTKVQQRLVWIGLLTKTTGVFDAKTVAAVRSFRDKWGFFGEPIVTAAVFKRLDVLTHNHGHLPKVCLTPKKVICVDMTQRVLRLVQLRKTVVTTDARFGTSQNPTVKGVFQVYRKDVRHVSSVYKTAMPYSLFFNGGSAVHFSPHFLADGYYGASHGCVNIRDLAVAKRLFRVTSIGTPVVIYAS